MFVEVEIDGKDRKNVDIQENTTVHDVKERISSLIDVPIDNLELQFNEKKLNDDDNINGVINAESRLIKCLISTNNDSSEDLLKYENIFPFEDTMYSSSSFPYYSESNSIVHRKYKNDPESFESSIIYIQNMGFPHKFAKHALRYTKYDVKAAIALLCGVTIEELEGRLKPDEDEVEEEAAEENTEKRNNTAKTDESESDSAESSDDDSYSRGRKKSHKKEKVDPDSNPTYATHWTPEQDELLYSKWMKYGSDWTRILKYFPGRTKAAVSLHWNASLRQKMIQSGRLTYNDLVRMKVRAPIAIDLASSTSDTKPVRRTSGRSRRSKRKMIDDTTSSSSSNEEESSNSSNDASDNNNNSKSDSSNSDSPKEEQKQEIEPVRKRPGRKPKKEITVWTEEDDENLFNAWMNFGNDWGQISTSLQGRDMTELAVRWNTVVKPRYISEGKLTEEMLRSKNSRAYSHMRQKENPYGEEEKKAEKKKNDGSDNESNEEETDEEDNDSSDSSDAQPEDSRRGRRRRSKSARSWTTEMDKILFEKWKIYGNDWGRYQKIFPDRTAVAIQLHWSTKLKKSLIKKGLLDPNTKPPRGLDSDTEEK
ncbi:Myb-like DNA-binding domain containing protein [Trichomonas vaginalis G3]|uniref:Myb-like DNA-binding domain containing protein n=1 Tax=Trichomonas vaginalis (strain ATCC PRA-98 / G3) TaxID=412133 RepID=A2G2D5_TRIV3|nr:MYB protein-related family [Trichomonas vaginalis G3]EAX88692.1 Myb-like DNA-binding domain containing protein [Trichomonas vaginalis G3]KAI5553097.1 MYB protein-related family [Trichomonas vaginalis G3]|eukprot:XP_001301622.1 Myb-like DNA-binding domain containing protein [Trichomonas vaginalis G3]